MTRARGRKKTSPTDGPPEPTLATDRATRARNTAALLAVCALSVLWLTLAMTTLFVGPSEWDDNQYCSIAAMPRPSTYVTNRYVHIWTLRIFYLMIDSRRTAAGLYAALTVVGLMWVGYALGRRMSGHLCGVIAAALMPLYPALLKYMTVPYCDEPMVLWSGAALVCALLASETNATRSRWLAIAASGLFCFMSIKCKESGVAVLPVVAMALWARAGRLTTLGLWVAGVLAAWIGLTVLDGIFHKDMWFSWRWSTYFPSPKPGAAPKPAGAPTIRCGAEYVKFLASREFLAFSLLGIGGALHSFRANRVVRSVALWALSVIVFQSLISVRHKGIHALDRYCVGLGVPLVVLSAHWLVTLWRRPSPADGHRPVGTAVVLLVLIGLTGYGLVADLAGRPDPTSAQWRCYFFLLPLTTIVLFAAPWLASGRWLPRTALVVLVAMTAAVNISSGLRDVKRYDAKLAPWVQLADALDDTGATVFTWKLPCTPYRPQRIIWRCRALSSQPPERIRVRQASSLGDPQLQDNALLMTDAKWWQADTPEQREMISRGWKPFIIGTRQMVDRQGFVVCRKAASSAGG